IIGHDQYLQQIDGMLYGSPPSEGIIKGRTYIHPALQIRFEVPPGFELFDTERQVYALGPANSQMVFDMAQAPAQLTPAAYITQTWTRKANLSNLNSIDVNGLAAATAWGRVRTNRGEMDLRLVAIRGSGDRVYRFRFLGPPQPGAIGNLTPVESTTLKSFRTISQREAAAAQPLRVRIVTVKTGDTIRSLSDRMAFDSFKLDRFLVLNGLKSSDRLVRGQRLKIVTE
ncbi:MAG: LysM peptidoglycan-binding domain-containing protein, partial [Candidatus Binataceae bacterium]